MSEGILDQISLGLESVIGTPVVPSVSIAVLPSDGVVVSQESVGVEAIDTNPAKNRDFFSGIRDFDGSFEMNAYPQGMGYILASALGADSPALVGSETLVYAHTLTEAVVKPSYTLEQVIGGLTERFAGFTVSGFTLTLAVGEPVKLAFTGKALSLDSGSSAITPSYEASKVFDWTDVVSITLGGTDIKCAIENLSLEYTNGLSAFHGLCGDVDPASLYLAPSEVKGSISAYLDANMVAQKAKFMDKDNQELVITLIGDETIGNASNNKLIITLPKVTLNTFAQPIDTGYVAVTADYVGATNDAGSQITAVLTNLVATY